MKRNFLLLLCLVALMAVCLASCAHEHTFSEAWSSDKSNHWHAATCEHGEIKDSLGAHTDLDEDGVCDVCNAETKHTHTFVDEWSFDDDNHWKAATCSHTEEKGELSLHSDDDSNGICDVCSGHVHDVNAAGYCKYSDCGKKINEIDETDINQLVSAVLAQKGLINGGHVDYNFIGRTNTANYNGVESIEDFDYVFGKDNYTYVKTVSKSTNGTSYAENQLEIWHQLVGPEDTFGVYSNDDGVNFALDISDVGKLEGPYIKLSNLAGEYGIENTLYALYEVAVGETASDLEVNSNTEENIVTFEYSYKTVFVNTTGIVVGDNAGGLVHNVNYFEVEVIFSYTDDYALTDLYIVCDCYTNDPGTADGFGFLYDDVDIEYDPETDTFIFVEYVRDNDGNGVFIPSDRRTPDTYTITVVQTVGERTEENPHPKSDFVPDSFDLYTKMDEETGALSNVVGEIMIVPVGATENNKLYVGNYKPANTSLHYVRELVSFEVFDEAGNIVTSGKGNDEGWGFINDTFSMNFTMEGEQRLFFFIPKVEGTYKVCIYFNGDLTHEIKVISGELSTDDVTVGENEFAVAVNDPYSWTNEVEFTATKTGRYTFNLPAGLGLVNADAYDAATESGNYNTVTPYYDPFDPYGPGSEIGGSFSLMLSEGQTIRMYASAAEKNIYVISYTVQ